jgi:hypothetical protein
MCRFTKCTKSDYSILLHVRRQTQQSAITPSRHQQHDHHTRPIVALRLWDQLCVTRYSHHNTNIVVNRRDAWCCGWCNITQRAPDAAIAIYPMTMAIDSMRRGSDWWCWELPAANICMWNWLCWHARLPGRPSSSSNKSSSAVMLVLWHVWCSDYDYVMQRDDVCMVCHSALMYAFHTK